MTNIRIGFGFDVHRLAAGEKMCVGGIVIPHAKGTVGHSDADVLIHAICDALLGAANLRDIGFHFPPTDDKYKNIDSKILLKKVIKLLDEAHFQLVNIDATICLEAPKINPHIPKMQKVLSTILKTDENNISIKATTNEKLGFIGKEDGVTAYAVVLVEKITG